MSFKKWKDNYDAVADASETETSQKSASEASNPDDDYLSKFEEELHRRKLDVKRKA